MIVKHGENSKEVFPCLLSKGKSIQTRLGYTSKRKLAWQCASNTIIIADSGILWLVSRNDDTGAK